MSLPPARLAALTAHFSRLGTPLSSIDEVRRTGRSQVHRVEAGGRRFWVKHSYRLPPGEERVLATLLPRWARHLPEVVCWLPEGQVTADLPGHDLIVADGEPAWRTSASLLGRLAREERAHVMQWRALGVRDRRPAGFAEALRALCRGPLFQSLEEEVQSAFVRSLPRVLAAFEEGFVHDGLVLQDAGCCNIRWTPAGPVLFDLADVVWGHPAFTLDRFLDQAPRSWHDGLITCFSEASAIPEPELRAMRRFNVLHEALRYHDELGWIAEAAPQHTALAEAAGAQIRVHVAHLGRFG